MSLSSLSSCFNKKEVDGRTRFSHKSSPEVGYCAVTFCQAFAYLLSSKHHCPLCSTKFKIVRVQKNPGFKKSPTHWVFWGFIGFGPSLGFSDFFI